MIIIMLILAVPLMFLAMMILVAGLGATSEESKDPEAALDAAFNGEDVATWQQVIGGLSEQDVIKGAAARGYRITAPMSRSGLMVFAKDSSKV